MRQLSQWEFGIYALALPRGHGFGEWPPIGAMMTDDCLACGILTQSVERPGFGFVVMRRRADRVWVVINEANGFKSRAEAEGAMAPHLVDGKPPEPIPPGVMERPALHDIGDRTPSDVFKLLTLRSHLPAAWVLN
ncbi:hypothetical protein [Billgrantia desiderata]|uniref:hypothetical protein n=1 Tax=Billgrantia desiderata TaxID=52021 RepID=UPI001F2AE85F|nr:hypothetical protein [Halomonas desiderata]